MRTKIIKRFAAGTVGICFAYALIRQSIAAVNNPNEVLAEWKAVKPSVVSEATQPESSYPETTAAETYRTEEYTREQHKNLFIGEEETTQPAEEMTEAPSTEIIEDYASSENSEEDEQLAPQTEGGGDVPTLTQFLSMMSCGGCRHNCLLVSPRCMKGRAKAESATVEYYETYGA